MSNDQTTAAIIATETRPAAIAFTFSEHDDAPDELFDYLSQALAGQVPFYSADETAPFYGQIAIGPKFCGTG